VVIEHILSGELEAPVDFVEDDDEWFVVLAGGAVLHVGGEARELRPNDWMFLRRGTPHRLSSTQPGTSWLTVRIKGE